MLAARSQGYYVTVVDRRLTLAEGSRLQGLTPVHSSTLTEPQLWKLLGNAVSVPVIRHIVSAALLSMGDPGALLTDIMKGPAPGTPIPFITHEGVRALRASDEDQFLGICEVCEQTLEDSPALSVSRNREGILGRCPRCPFFLCAAC